MEFFRISQFLTPYYRGRRVSIRSGAFGFDYMKQALKRSAILSLLLAAACVAPAAAQWGPWGGGYYASTAGEGFAMGMADVVVAAGAANLMNSAAAINVEEARSKYLDNQIKYTDTYYTKRRMHQSYVEETRRPRQSAERLASLAKRTPPAPLSEQELDQVTGQISWPNILRDEQYEPMRLKLDNLFSERAESGGNVSYKQATEIAETSSEFSAELKKRLKEYPSGEYMNAKRFLERLSLEGSTL